MFSSFQGGKEKRKIIMITQDSLLRLLLILCIFSLSPSLSSPVSLSVTPKTLSRSGDSVTVKWSGVDSPSDLDWLGIYSPPDSSFDNFIGYVFLNSSSEWKSGLGQVTLPLVNLRSNYEFRIFRWTQDEINPKKLDHDHNPLPGTKHLLGRSEEVGFESRFGPDQVHLAFTERDDEMRVMFVAGNGEERFVKYGLRRDQMRESVGTTVRRYEREHMCDSPANESIGWRDPGFIHDGVMKNLKKGKRYYYKVGSDVGGWSETYSFVSRNEDSAETIAFLFGDMGAATPYSTFLRTQEESLSTIKWILRDLEALGDKPAFISHIGDISYARGYSWLWDTFFAQIEPVASKVAYHVCIGNHEYDWPLQPWKGDWSQPVYGKDGGGECGVPYSLKFHMPGNSSEPTGTHAPATQNLYYSFDMGAVHFMYISTETNFFPGSNQYNFIKHDLETVDRKKTPFVVVQGHRPMYTTSNEIRDTSLRKSMSEHLEPLLVKNKVSLALWGHVHRYERFCPLNNFTCASMGGNDEKIEAFPVHVVIGMAGQDWQQIWTPRANHLNDPIFPQPAQSLYRGGEFGYTRLVATKEKLTFSYVGNHDGEVHDMMEILANGRVISGESVAVSQNTDTKDEKMESNFSRYAKAAGVLVLGAFMGYIVGFISHVKRENGLKSNWVPVKTEVV